MSSEVEVSRRGAAVWFTLNRPAKRNALTPAMVAGLNLALDEVDAMPDVGAIVITGAGTAFCAGADLEFFRSAVDAVDGCEMFVGQLLEPLRRFLSRLRNSELPVIAAVNGACAAGGLETILCCDLIVADRAATFSDAHSRLGLAPALGGASALVASLGAHRAAQLMLLADTYDAETLASWGLVSAVAEPGGLDDAVAALVERLSLRSPASIATMKRLVQRSAESSWDALVAADMASFRELWRSPDLREGLQAYLDRRQPSFVR